MPVVTVAEALRRYGAEVGPARASQYVALVTRYLEGGGTNTDASLTAYLRAMERRGMRPSTVDLHRRTIRAFYRHLKMSPPRAKSFEFDRDDVARPALAREVVERMVAAARASSLPGWHVALLALSTTYGMRAVELARVGDVHVDQEGARLYVRTAKHGQVRWCHLPPEIAPYMLAAWPRGSTTSANKAYARLWAEAFDTTRPKGVAWHSVRRSLHRDLEAAGVSEADRARFGRWRGTRSMANLYARPNQTVGVEGVEQARTEDEGAREYDAAVWDHHPYTGLWG